MATTLVKRRTSSNPFEVRLVSNRLTPGEVTEPGANASRRFVFDVVSKKQRQRYEVDAYSYEDARNLLRYAVDQNMRNVDDGPVSKLYNERDSSAVATAAIVTIAAGTLAVAWIVRRAYAWFTEAEDSQ